jgi:uncharacterized membrane protein
MADNSPVSPPSFASHFAPPAPKSDRLIWLDIARGTALVAMAIYHFTWDLEFFGYTTPGTAATGGWRLFARAIASSFLFLAGFSLVLANHPVIRWQGFARRLAMIVAAAGLISVATYIATPSVFIFFGILHAIALASLVGLLFLRAPVIVMLLAAAAALAAPFYLRHALFDTPALWWVGLSQTVPRSNDYVPLLPWIAPFLVGMAAARLSRGAGWLRHLAWRSDDRRPNRLHRLLAYGGRHSLAVYLLHQPVLIALLYGASLVAPPPPVDPVQSYQQSCQASCIAEQDAAFCARFCDCTLGALLDTQTFNDLMSGAITPQNDSRVAGIASQCSIEAFQ